MCVTSTDVEFRVFLAELQSPLRMLRRNYVAGNAGAHLYTSASTLAYLVAYTPQYIYQSRDFFRKTVYQNDSSKNFRRFTMVGCGPGTEIIGLVDFLEFKFPEQKFNLELLLLDSHHSEWSEVRKTLLQTGLSQIPNVRATIESVDFDFDVENSLLDLVHFENSEVVTLFNVLNESKNMTNLKKNICSIWDALPVGAIFASLEQGKNIGNSVGIIPQANKKAKEIYAHLRRHVGLPNEQIPGIHLIFPEVLPTLLTETLLDGSDGCIPRKRIGYVYLVLQKTQDSVVELQSLSDF